MINAMDAMDESKKIEKDLDHLETTLSSLKRDYDSFFSGATKQPPFDGRKKVETTIKRFSANPNFSYAQRFRFNSLVARFNSYQDLWSKQLRMKEEGRTPSGGLITDSKPKLTTVKMPPRDQKLQLLYHEYLSTREKTGEGKPNFDFQAFCELLKKQQEQIINRFQCKDVEFFVKIEEGHTKLKARPVK
jgi:hypothetical protein